MLQPRCSGSVNSASTGALEEQKANKLGEGWLRLRTITAGSRLHSARLLISPIPRLVHARRIFLQDAPLLACTRRGIGFLQYLLDPNKLGTLHKLLRFCTVKRGAIQKKKISATCIKQYWS